MINSRLISLDGLRGLACILVVFYHYLYRYGQIYPSDSLSYISYFNVGVPIFFFISGFVIYLTLPKAHSLIDFFVLRGIRLYPTYWCCVIITFVFVSYFGLNGREVDFTSFILNFMMFHQIFGVPSVDGVYWSLMVELIFYFWIGIFFFVCRKFNFNIFYILFLWISISLISLFTDLSLFSNFFILSFISPFIAGIAFYRLSQSGFNYQNLTLFIFSMFVVYLYYDFFVLIFVTFVPAVLMSKYFTYLFSMKYIVFFGKISYPLYLVHQNIGYSIINQLHTNGFNFYFSVFLALITSVLISYIINMYVENIFTKKVKNLYVKICFK